MDWLPLLVKVGMADVESTTSVTDMGDLSLKELVNLSK